MLELARQMGGDEGSSVVHARPYCVCLLCIAFGKITHVRSAIVVADRLRCCFQVDTALVPPARKRTFIAEWAHETDLLLSARRLAA